LIQETWTEHSVSVKKIQRDHLRDPDVDGNAILKWTLEKWFVKMSTGITDSKHNPIAGFCDHVGEPWKI
jgi:hypothetical protein